MPHKAKGSIALLFALFLFSCAGGSSGNGAQEESGLSAAYPSASPYYFIAVHMEPYHSQPLQKERIADEYCLLETMVEKANGYTMKLTLMFSVPWVEYIMESPERIAEVQQWQEQGHEIAVHHHDIYGGTWDGFTEYSSEEAVRLRTERAGSAEEYRGTLADLMAVLGKTPFSFRSGCTNEEYDKNSMPDEIICSTCSGYAGFGEPGTTLADKENPDRGRNAFITTGMWKGIRRKWLSPFLIDSDLNRKDAQDTFSSMEGGEVFGGLMHSQKDELSPFISFLEFLHEKDPSGGKSRTVSEIINGGILPEREIAVPRYLEEYKDFFL